MCNFHSLLHGISYNFMIYIPNDHLYSTLAIDITNDLIMKLIVMPRISVGSTATDIPVLIMVLHRKLSQILEFILSY